MPDCTNFNLGSLLQKQAGIVIICQLISCFMIPKINKEPFCQNALLSCISSHCLPTAIKKHFSTPSSYNAIHHTICFPNLKRYCCAACKEICNLFCNLVKISFSERPNSKPDSIISSARPSIFPFSIPFSIFS